MNWNLEGKHINGLYMGLFPISGKVELSRVQYGGEVSHHIQLDEPIKVYGAVRDRVILEHKFVNRIMDSAELRDQQIAASCDGFQFETCNFCEG